MSTGSSPGYSTSEPAPFNLTGKAGEDGPSSWDPVTNMGEPDEDPGSWLLAGPVPVIWGVSEPVEGRFLPL